MADRGLTTQDERSTAGNHYILHIHIPNPPRATKVKHKRRSFCRLNRWQWRRCFVILEIFWVHQQQMRVVCPVQNSHLLKCRACALHIHRLSCFHCVWVNWWAWVKLLGLVGVLCAIIMFVKCYECELAAVLSSGSIVLLAWAREKLNVRLFAYVYVCTKRQA